MSEKDLSTNASKAFKDLMKEVNNTTVLMLGIGMVLGAVFGAYSLVALVGYFLYKVMVKGEKNGSDS